MRKHVAAAFGLTLIFMSAAFAQVVPEGITPGRFQLFQAKYMFVNCAGAGYPAEDLVLLDTATGKAYVASYSTWKRTKGFEQLRTWVPFENKFEFATCDVKAP